MKYLTFCPTLLALLFLTQPSARAADLYDRNDAWEYPNLSFVFTSSVYAETDGSRFDARDIFGGLFGDQEPQSGHFAFGDTRDVTQSQSVVTNLIEIDCIKLTPLTGYKVALASDGAIRMASQITLRGLDRSTGGWKQLDQYTPLYNSVGNPNHANGPVSETNRLLTLTNLFVAKKFQIEVLSQADGLGSRVIEIDAVTQTNSSEPLLSVTSPAENSTHAIGTDISITYSANDPDTIDSVELYAQNALIEAGGATGTFKYKAPATGPLNLKVKAIDGLGGETVVERNVIINDPNAPKIDIRGITSTDGEFSFEIFNYTVGREIAILSSTDLRIWTRLTAQTPAEQTWRFTDPKGESRLKYYRAEELLR